MWVAAVKHWNWSLQSASLREPGARPETAPTLSAQHASTLAPTGADQDQSAPLTPPLSACFHTLNRRSQMGVTCFGFVQTTAIISTSWLSHFIIPRTEMESRKANPPSVGPQLSSDGAETKLSVRSLALFYFFLCLQFSDSEQAITW